MHNVFYILPLQCNYTFMFFVIRKFIVQEYKKIRHREITRGIKSLITLSDIFYTLSVTLKKNN